MKLEGREGEKGVVWEVEFSIIGWNVEGEEWLGDIGGGLRMGDVR